MADLIIQDTTLQAIADAIRAKTGGSEALTPSQMASEVTDKLSAGGGSGGDIDALIDGSITEIESNAEKIVAYTFNRRTGLVSASFPNVKVIDYDTFTYSGLKTINAPNVTSIGSEAFLSCPIESVDFPKLTSVGAGSFEQCRSLKSANLPSLTTINRRAFYACSNLRQLTSGQLKSIASEGLNGCSTLTDIGDTSNVTTIGTYAFQYCSRLARANFPLVTAIESQTFSFCYLLKSVVLPRVTTIKASSNFNSNSSLIKVIIGTETDTVCTLASLAFGNCYHILGTTSATYNPNGLKDGYIYVPNALVASYRTTTNWSTYASQIMPWVATTEELANIDTTLYDKACVGYENDGTEYSYDGTQWTEVIR